ncbi:MAG: hypothetical protein D6782_13370, partial [Alphaproteobacteria bacterium]
MTTQRPWLVITSAWPADGHPAARALAALAQEHSEAVAILAPAAAASGQAAATALPVYRLAAMPLKGAADHGSHGRLAMLKAILAACRRHRARLLAVDGRIALGWVAPLLRRLFGRKLLVIGDSPPAPAATRPNGDGYLDFTLAADATTDSVK